MKMVRGNKQYTILKLHSGISERLDTSQLTTKLVCVMRPNFFLTWDVVNMTMLFDYLVSALKEVRDCVRACVRLCVLRQYTCL